MLMFRLKSHGPENNRDILPGASNLDSACWNNSSCLCPCLCHCPRTVQCPLSPGTDKPVTQLKYRGISMHTGGNLYSQDLALSYVPSAHISHGLGKCLPFSCITPLVVARKDSQRVCNPWLHFRLCELPWPEDRPLPWQNKDVNSQLLCYCPSPPGVPVSFPN